jgi:hypothetical protein|tara:strand:- start:417 stop:623 length:207 start_codon:yes stop_codon:yes gene_type:complete
MPQQLFGAIGIDVCTPEYTEKKVGSTKKALLKALQARRPKKSFFLDTLCRAKNDPLVTKIWLWASFGV